MIDNKTIRKVIMLNKCLKGGSPTYENREASGAVANFTTNVVMPFVKCECTIDATESGTDELTLTKTGANVWDEETLNGYYDRNNQGAYVANNNFLCSKNLISVKPNTSYFWCIDFNATFSGRVLYFDKEGNYLSTSESNTPKRAFTTPSDCYFIHWYVYKPDTYTYNNDISINYPSTDTSYHAYTGSTYTVALEEAAYGGSVDVISGSGQIIDEHGDLVYTLFEPVSISALEGVNNVWCDTGDIKVTYKYKTGEGGSSTKKYLPIFYDLYGEEKYK